MWSLTVLQVVLCGWRGSFIRPDPVYRSARLQIGKKHMLHCLSLFADRLCCVLVFRAVSFSGVVRLCVEREITGGMYRGQIVGSRGILGHG